MRRFTEIADGVGPRCPACDNATNEVADTRRHQGRIFRTRKCRCGYRFGTVELVTDQTSWRAVRGEPFSILGEAP